MFFPHGLVHTACAGNLDDPAHFEQVVELFSAQPGSVADWHNRLRTFLKSLPPADDQLKIAERLQEMAREHEAALGDLHWWDIMRGEIVLRGTLTHRGKDIQVTFYWKKAIKNERYLPTGLSQKTVRRIPRHTGPWVVDFEAITYAEVKGQFKQFLQTPLVGMIDLSSDAP